MFKRLLWAGLFLMLAIRVTQNAQADGGINLRTQADFAGALAGANPLFTGLNSGNAADPNTIVTALEYPGLSSLMPQTTLNTGSLYHFVPSVAVPNNTIGIGGALYRYPTDPDLSTYNADLKIYIPQLSDGAPGSSGIDIFSFALIDHLNRTKFWQFNNMDLTAGMNQIHMDLFDGGEGWLPTHIDKDFDITQVDYVQMSFHGELTDSFPVNPDPNNQGTLWLGAQELVLSTPEPGSLLTLTACAVGATLHYRALLRRRKRALREKNS